jgi:hypothetical protein
MVSMLNSSTTELVYIYGNSSQAKVILSENALTATLIDGTIWQGELMSNGTLIVKQAGAQEDVIVTNLMDGSIQALFSNGSLTQIPNIFDPDLINKMVDMVIMASRFGMFG